MTDSMAHGVPTRNLGLPRGWSRSEAGTHLAGAVASMTEDDPGVVSEQLPTTLLCLPREMTPAALAREDGNFAMGSTALPGPNPSISRGEPGQRHEAGKAFGCSV